MILYGICQAPFSLVRRLGMILDFTTSVTHLLTEPVLPLGRYNRYCALDPSGRQQPTNLRSFYALTSKSTRQNAVDLAHPGAEGWRPADGLAAVRALFGGTGGCLLGQGSPCAAAGRGIHGAVAAEFYSLPLPVWWAAAGRVDRHEHAHQGRRAGDFRHCRGRRQRQTPRYASRDCRGHAPG